MSNIEKAIEVWFTAIAKVWNMLTTPIESWGAGNEVYSVVENIHNLLRVSASALVVMLFLYGFLKRTTRLQDLKRPEVIFQAFLKLCIAIGIVNSALLLMRWLFNIFHQIIAVIHGAGVLPEGTSPPEEVINALNETSLASWDGIVIGIVGLIAVVVVFVMSIMLLVTAWGRFLNMYLHIAVSGLFFAFFASEETSHIGISFLKSAMNAAFRGVVIAVALVIYSKIVTSGGASIEGIFEDGDNFGIVMSYMFSFLVGGFVTLGLCKSGDVISQRMGF